MSLTKDDLSEDIRHLIVMDTQFGWRGSTELKHEMMLRLEARGWVSEGHENAEYDLTDEGQSVISAALAMPKPAGAVPLPDGWDVRMVDGEVMVSAPNFDPGAMFPSPTAKPLAERLLHAFATAILKADSGSRQPAADGDLVLVERALLGAACSAIDKKRDAPRVVEALRKITMTPAAEGREERDIELAETLIEQIAPYTTNGGQFVVDSETAPIIVDALRCYASPTPAADAGGVMVNREMAVRAEAEYFKRVGLSSQPLVVRQEAMLHALTAALTPEVRHGE